MCSSSLTAIHEACEHLRRNACEMAIAGGVNLYLHPTSYLSLCAQHMLSLDGQCRSFGRGGNGFVPGEGVGVVLLKSLSKAIEDQDRIYGLIRGTSVNHGGKTNGYTVPNPKAQGDLIREALEKAGINARAVSYIEAHGTGTELGDPIEIRGLTQAFEKDTRDTGFCAVGSAKSNLGHLEAAAGIAGVAKILLQMKHKALVPSLHAKELNPNIDFAKTPFLVNQDLRDWQNPIIDGKAYPRIAGISAFGAGGSNAHVLIEEYPDQQKSERIVVASSSPVIVMLSAKNPDRLKEHAENLLQFIRSHETSDSQTDLADLAYTLQVGREAMEERLGLIVHSMQELKEKLQGFIEGRKDEENLYRGQVKRNKETLAVFAADEELQEAIGKWIQRGKFTKLLDLWVKGLTFDWNKLYGDRKPRRISLPTYPFARERYWVESENPVPHVKPVVAKDDDEQRDQGSEKPWPFFKEAWIPFAIPHDLDWKDRLKQYEGKIICVLYSDEKDKEGLCTLIKQLEHAGGLSKALQIQPLNVGDMNSDSFSEIPDVILFLGPPLSSNGAIGPIDKDMTNVFHVSQSLMKRAWGKSIKIYYLYESRLSQPRLDCEDPSGFLNSAMTENDRHVWKWIGSYDRDIPVTRYQLLLREWLADEPAGGNSTALAEIRYEKSERFVRHCWGARSQDRPKTIYLLEKNWKLKNLNFAETTLLQGNILVLVNRESIKIGQELFQGIKSAEVILVGEVSLKSDQIKYSIDYKDAESGRNNSKIILEQVKELACIVDLSDLYNTPQEKDDDPMGKITFYQTVLSAVSEIDILYFTKGLQSFQSTPMSLAGAKFAGLIKMLSSEYPHVVAKFIDVDQTCYDDRKLFEKIINREVNSPLEETEICYRQGNRFVPYVEAQEIGDHQQENPIADMAFPISKEGVYVISGGTNGIGLEIGKYLISRGVQKLVLMGISALPPKADWDKAVRENNSSRYIKEKLIQLIKIDKEIPNLQIYTGPLENTKALKHFFDHIRSQVGEIKGVVHGAGVYSDTKTVAFFAKDVEYMQKVLKPKVAGLEVLDDLFKNDRLDFFVSFSSLTGLIPRLARGVSDYAMANAFLDFFAAYQFHQKNKKFYKTITWVDWNETGGASRASPETQSLLEDTLNQEGLFTFSNQEGCRFFEKSMMLKNRNWVLLSFLDERAFHKEKEELLFGKPKQSFAKTECKKPFGDRIEDQIAQWEHQQKMGNKISSSEMKRLLSIEDITRLNPSLLGRVYELIFHATDNANPSVAGSTRVVSEFSLKKETA